jgi:hypothetical protein
MIAPSERHGDIGIILTLMAIGVYAIVDSEAMPSGQFDVSGPGTFPGLLGIALCVVSAIALVGTWLKKSREVIDIGHKDAWRIMFATIAVGISMKYLGFVISIALFVFFLLKLLSKTNWVKCAAISVAGALGAYLIFDTIIGIQLPGGIISNIM